MRDGYTLAFHNIGNGAVINLTVKERGRKK